METAELHTKHGTLSNPGPWPNAQVLHPQKLALFSFHSSYGQLIIIEVIISTYSISVPFLFPL